MSRVFCISDLHFGHEKILEFSGPLRQGYDSESHDQSIIDAWNAVVHSRDTVYVLGDVAFGTENLEKVKQLKGRKILIRGNHDVYNINRYLCFFDDVHGIFKYRRKGFKCWMTHCPIHPDELRGCINIHGHVHENSIRDSRYVNVCVENTGPAPVLMDDIVDGWRGRLFNWDWLNE